MICPVCGREQTAFEFKSNAFDDDGNLIEHYPCHCGVRFCVVVFNSDTFRAGDDP